MELDCQVCGTKVFGKNFTESDKITCSQCWEA